MWSVRDYPIPAIVLAALGGLTLAKFALTAQLVFLQTFVFFGINVRFPSQSQFTMLSVRRCSCPSLVQKRVHGQASFFPILNVTVPEAYYKVVTGATDGIGREFASQLAKAGFNILIASRNAEKLNAVAAELGMSHSIRFRVAVC